MLFWDVTTKCRLMVRKKTSCWKKRHAKKIIAATSYSWQIIATTQYGFLIRSQRLLDSRQLSAEQCLIEAAFLIIVSTAGNGQESAKRSTGPGRVFTSWQNMYPLGAVQLMIMICIYDCRAQTGSGYDYSAATGRSIRSFIVTLANLTN